MKELSYLIAVVFWVFGFALAKGFWSSFFAFIFPFYGWYLCAEFTLKFINQ